MKHIDYKENKEHKEVSMADLLAAQNEISRMIRDKSLPFSTGIDVKENQVTVEITDQELWESALRESGIKLPDYVVSQVIYEPLRGEPEFPVTPAPGLFFPQLRARSATSMTALLEGQLIEENGCLRVASSDSVNSRLIIWQPDYFLTLNGEQIEVLNREGQVPARLGEPISLGGGEVQLSNYVGQLRQPIPTACEGPYFLM